MSEATAAVSVSSHEPLHVAAARPVIVHSLPAPIPILHIISDLCVAGAEIKLCKVLAATNRERFAPSVISMRDQGDLREQIEAMGIRVRTLGIRGSLPGPVSVARLIRIVRSLRPALIHGWMYHGNLAAQFAAMSRRERPSVLWSVHQSLYNFDYEKRLTAQIIKFCARISRLPDKILYISATSATQHEAAGYDKEKRVVVHYGFDTERFAPSQTARSCVRRELRLPEDAILIGLVGRYHPIKDHANFLRAASLLSQGRTNMNFVLCGKEVDKNNTSLLDLVREHKLDGRIHLLGERRDIQSIIASLDIAVSSSCSEGFPNVVGEAMSSAVPCVVTDVSDLPEIVANTGRVVPPRDCAALAAAIEELVALGPEGRQLLGASARERIIERYSLESSVAQYETIYDSLTVQARANSEKNLVLSRAVEGIS